VTGSGTNTLTITGTLPEVNADLATFSYSSSTSGSDTVTVTASGEHGGAATPQPFTVLTSGPPTIAAPTSVIVGLGQATAISGVTISETPAISGETFKATLTDDSGLLAATGTGVSGSGTTSLTITGSLSQVNADLATLTDTGASAATDTITINASDSYGETATPVSIAVLTSGPPTIAAPASAPLALGVATPISGVSISESPTTAGETFKATLTDANGLLGATGTGVSGSGTTSLTIVGSLSKVNADLATLTDDDVSAAPDTITIKTRDSNNGTANPASIAVAAVVNGSSPVSTTSDAYTWIGSSVGSWDSAANWEDVTSGADPATSAPGSGDPVTIAGPTGSTYDVIVSGGNSASLVLTGNVDLSGAYGTNGLTVGSVSGWPYVTLFASGELTVESASQVAAATADVVDGELAIAGAGATGPHHRGHRAPSRPDRRHARHEPL
jgi:hypothetical protein